MSSIIVSDLYIHPVKSLASVAVESAMLDGFGLHNDRRWMIVDCEGVFVTQRFIPSMCLISATANQNQLLLKAEGMAELIVSESDYTNVTRVTVWHDQCQAVDCGDVAATWLTQFLNKACRLVYFPENEIRQVDLTFANEGEKTGFSDGFPLLLISQASLDDLNHRLKTPVEMQRFRPNIVVSGCDAFAEDSWKTIRIGEISYRIVKACSRCSMPSINPITAVREPEPVKTLRSYRSRNNKVYFGQNVIAEAEGAIKKGMQVQLLD